MHIGTIYCAVLTPLHMREIRDSLRLLWYYPYSITVRFPRKVTLVWHSIINQSFITAELNIDFVMISVPHSKPTCVRHLPSRLSETLGNNKKCNHFCEIFVSCSFFKRQYYFNLGAGLSLLQVDANSSEVNADLFQSQHCVRLRRRQNRDIALHNYVAVVYHLCIFLSLIWVQRCPPCSSSHLP